MRRTTTTSNFVRLLTEAKIEAETVSYLRGINLINKTADTTEYYLFNAHGDVVNLVNSTGTTTKTYDYDAFGNERNPDSTDENPFRYCGEYYDTETGTYYLRARYYDPAIGRFTQQDTHWNTANMIYGDNPQKINEREDKLGLKSYSYEPQLEAIVQAGNLYIYGISNPVFFFDPTGKLAASATVGIAVTAGASNAWNPVGWILLGCVVVICAVEIGMEICDNNQSSVSQAARRNSDYVNSIAAKIRVAIMELTDGSFILSDASVQGGHV